MTEMSTIYDIQHSATADTQITELQSLYEQMYPIMQELQQMPALQEVFAILLALLGFSIIVLN